MKFTGLKDIFRFAIYFFVVASVTFAFLYLFGLVPEEIEMKQVQYPQKKVAKVIENEIPTRIVMPSIGIDVSIYNPESTDVKTLDDFLARGAVRYPGSGLLGDGNMLLFGHSSYLKTVNNPAYKTFNEIQNLKVGDRITVYSAKKTFTYVVSSVKMMGAESALVDFSSDRDMLTLSTCNSFGSKEERYVVEADLI